MGDDSKMLVGGQVINGLTQPQFSRLFDEGIINGNDDHALKKSLGIELNQMPAPESTDLVPMYELISDEMMRKYLANEFSLYLSQGCRYSCDFCAAERTFKDPASGKVKKAVKEVYRDQL